MLAAVRRRLSTAIRTCRCRSTSSAARWPPTGCSRSAFALIGRRSRCTGADAHALRHGDARGRGRPGLGAARRHRRARGRRPRVRAGRRAGGAAGVLISMFLTFSAAMGVVFTMKALIIVIMGGVGNMLGALVAGLHARPGRDLRWRSWSTPASRSPSTYALFLAVLLFRPTGPVREAGALKPRDAFWVAAAAARVVAAAGRRAAVRQRLSARARHQPADTSRCWRRPGRCSPGPTHYISLATAAFFGIGAYTIAVLADSCRGRWCWSRAARSALLRGAGRRAVDAAPVRHLFRHLQLRPGRTDPPARHLVRGQHLTARSAATSSSTPRPADLLAAAGAVPSLVLGAGWLIRRSRLGLALRVIGEDETVARHVGIDTTRAKLALFAVSAAFMTRDRRDHGAALDLYRSGDRLQSGDLVPGRHHGAVRRRRRAVRGRCSAPCRWCCCSSC